jgi:hypothetical protein
METNTTTARNYDVFDDEGPKKLPSGLNVLTILTFIGCGLAFLGILYSLYTNTPSVYEKNREKITEQMDKVDTDTFPGSMMKGQLETMEKAHQYHWPLFIAGLIGTGMCLVGALRMRKLQKSGYPLYVIGELAPVIVSGVLLGFAGMQFIIGLVIAVVFVLLYTAQRKHLVNP